MLLPPLNLVTMLRYIADSDCSRYKDFYCQFTICTGHTGDSKCDFSITLVIIPCNNLKKRMNEIER